MFDLAFSTLDIKSIQDDDRIIEGIASTPQPDRRGDILVSSGAEFQLPMPLLWQHNPHHPVGEVIEARVTPAGISIRAKFANVSESGALKDRLDEAWQQVKHKLVRGLSVGWKPIEAEPLKKAEPWGPMRVTRWMWAELSAVTIPMNQAATILNIKSAALGLSLPHAVGAHPVVHTRSVSPMKTFTEQKAEYEATRSTKSARMVELMTKAHEKDGGTLDDEAQKEYDGLSGQVKALDAHIARCVECEALQVKAAQPVPPDASGLRQQAVTPVVQVKSRVEPGTAFIRYCMALVNSKGDSMKAINFAQRWKDSTPEVELMVKAAVNPGNTTDASWAGVLVTMKNATGEFLELLRPATILGKVPGLRQVPFNTQVPVQTGGGTYAWVGQGAAKPVGKLALTTIGLGFSKAAGIIVITQELAKLSDPSAEAVVRADMVAGMAAFLDQQFIDPAVALVPNVSPASITNGAETAASTDAPFSDLHKIATYFATNQIPLAGLTLIMSETNALTMGMIRDASGGQLFPGMTAAGGTAMGMNVVASNAAGTNVIGVHPQGVLYADEGGLQIDVSTEASVMMDSAPVPGTTAFTSFFQNNLIGLRAERMINWNRARPKSVYYLTDAAYAPGTPAIVE